MKPGSFTIVYTACPSIVAKIRMGCSALFLSTYFPVSPHPCRRRSHWLAWPKLAVKTVNWKLFFLLINCILNAYYELSFIQYSFVLYLPSISVEIFILRRSFVSSFWYHSHSPNVSTTPITEMGCRQCLPLSVVQLKGKHCRNPHCRNGVVDTFGHRHNLYQSPFYLPCKIWGVNFSMV